MIDLKRTKEEKKESVAESPIDAVSDYPYGLCISFDEDTLEKLGLEEEDVEVGDMIHIHALGKVTSVSRYDNETNGPCSRVEVQLTNMVGVEDEESEDEESESVLKKLYL
jgi:hypothetical protein